MSEIELCDASKMTGHWKRAIPVNHSLVRTLQAEGRIRVPWQCPRCGEQVQP